MNLEEIRKKLERTSEGYEWTCPECGEKIGPGTEGRVTSKARIHYYSEHQMEREPE